MGPFRDSMLVSRTVIILVSTVTICRLGGAVGIILEGSVTGHGLLGLGFRDIGWGVRA